MSDINIQLLQEKADVIARCVKRVSSKKPDEKEELLRDLDRQDIITLNLERAVQASVDMAAHVIAYTSLPAAATMADSFLILKNAGVLDAKLTERMRKAVGLRNLLVHEYQKIDWNIVWSVLTRHLHDPLDFAKAVLDWASRR